MNQPKPVLIPKWQFSQSFFILQLTKSLPFYIPPAWKWYPFRGEPPRIVHYRERPPPPDTGRDGEGQNCRSTYRNIFALVLRGLVGEGLSCPCFTGVPLVRVFSLATNVGYGCFWNVESVEINAVLLFWSGDHKDSWGWGRGLILLRREGDGGVGVQCET